MSENQAPANARIHLITEGFVGPKLHLQLKCVKCKSAIVRTYADIERWEREVADFKQQTCRSTSMVA